MAVSRYLIINADDFGLCRGVNRGIAKAYQDGIVTSASLMVRAKASREAARYAKIHRSLSVGLHVDLGEWTCENGEWEPVYQVVDLEDTPQIRENVIHQLARFNQLVGRNPSHIDSHQHVHLREPIREVLTSIAEELGVPLRQVSGQVNYCGDFYGQTEEGSPLPKAITVSNLIRIMMLLPPGVTEMACHPGEADVMDTMYSKERKIETATLSDPRVRDAVSAMDIRLCSFHQIPKEAESLL
jgi:predicted glycoside hydrolase/deacetylase ChbG (UPF0249 family)